MPFLGNVKSSYKLTQLLMPLAKYLRCVTISPISITLKTISNSYQSDRISAVLITVQYKFKQNDGWGTRDHFKSLTDS